MESQEFDDIYSHVADIEGWMPVFDCRSLWEYTKNVEGLIVEIGCYAGKSTKLIALSSPKSKIIAIDNFKGKFKKVKKKFLKNTKGLNIKLIRKKSDEVKWNRMIDFLHIDGNHSYTQFKRDFNKWIPFLKSGHYALFHDYNADIKLKYGVKRVIDTLGPKYFSKIITDPNFSGFAICQKS